MVFGKFPPPLLAHLSIDFLELRILVPVRCSIESRHYNNIECDGGGGAEIHWHGRETYFGNLIGPNSFVSQC
jgi:hypothetical protein